MHTLQFHPTWAKALSRKDEQLITAIFEKSIGQTGIFFIPVREAINHQQALLVTVLIHNATKQPFQIADTLLSYEKTSIQSKARFTLPFAIPAHTSMPWTFIFPGLFNDTVLGGQLQIVNNG